MYTYDDYLKKKAEYGFDDGSISDADEQLAQNNPDAGISLLTYKNDWNTATNDSAKAFAHEGAESIRKQYGGYSGGDSGGSFALAEPEKTYQEQYDDLIDSYMKNMQKSFSYDPNTDPNTKYYTNAYRREGERAAQNTLGALAQNTGGIASSYAAAAAQQANNYYAQQLADKYPELYKQAYDQFLSEYSRQSDLLGQARNLENDAYTRYLNELNYDYQKKQDDLALMQQKLENEWYQAQLKSNMEYQLKALDASERQAAAELAYKYASLMESGRQADAETAYKYASLSEEAKQFVDTLSYQLLSLDASERQASEELAYKYASLQESARQADAETAYKNASLSEEEKQFDDTLAYQLALLGADYGDYSGLRNLGINIVDTTEGEALLAKQRRGEPLTDTEQYLLGKYLDENPPMNP